MFKDINPPPSDHHGFALGLSTEFGDSAKIVAEKVNAGFAHVYGVLKGLGATLADEVEYVAKTEFDAACHEIEELRAELNNVKMMVQGFGFVGAKPMSLTPTPVPPDLVVTSTAKSEPIVTVTEKSDS